MRSPSLLTSTGHGFLRGLEAEEVSSLRTVLQWLVDVVKAIIDSRSSACRCSSANLGPQQWQLFSLPRVERSDSRIVLFRQGWLRLRAIFRLLILCHQICSSYNENSAIHAAQLLSELDFGCGQGKVGGPNTPGVLKPAEMSSPPLQTTVDEDESCSPRAVLE